MMLWIVVSVLLLASVLALLAPLLRRPAPVADRAEHGFEVLRDQLAEVERDRANGRLDPTSADAARLEIERRLLAEDERREQERATGEAATAEAGRRRRLAAAVLVMLVVPVGSVMLYLSQGRPDLPDAPLASRSAERARMAEIAESRRGLAEMATDLERRLADQPDDVDGWLLLGRTRLTLGQADAAVEAFRHATVAGGGDAQTFAQLGEALVRANDGVVGAEAREAFQQALEKMPGEPRSRFYIGLAHRQAGQIEEALDWWLALEADTPPEAAWRQALASRIREAATEADVDLAALRAKIRGNRPAQPPVRGPDASDVAAAQQMAPEDRVAMIQGMVDGLAARLEANPDDLEGWRRLGRSYLVLNRRADAVEAYRRAAEIAPDDIEILLDYAHALFPPGTSEREMPPAFAAVIDQVRALEPDNAEGLFFGGLIAVRRGDHAEARELWGQLVRKLPADSSVRDAVQRRLDTLPKE
ncbi:MAG: c-type cytochrome biogenesis protein CcmI [Thalassobaculum sp.]|uniref:c-type cytochrome biogenesis protein CcmI n=1 Tax=Thalassobaculum sp. TaxID=2022740 RepID=UPI0032EC6938